MKLEPIEVSLKGGRYPIHVGRGLIARVGSLISSGLASDRIAVVTDRTVAGLHADRLTSALESAGLQPELFDVPPRENSKSLHQFETLMDRLLDMKMGRDGAIVAFGGGVIGDLAGFAAATLYRGVRLVQIPTTLLAQVDSSIGGKTGINTPRGKNLIGAYHQPISVIADMDLLQTLPAHEMLSGYAEIVKIALLGDREFYCWLELNGPNALNGDQDALLDAVYRSCAAKAAVVSADELEDSVRSLLNLGHTFAHAIEAVEGYSGNLTHGSAVAVGISLACEVSRRMKQCPDSLPLRVTSHLLQAGLPTEIQELSGAPYDPRTLMEKMKLDKKIRHGALRFVLLRDLGDAFLCDTPDLEIIGDVLERACTKLS